MLPLTDDVLKLVEIAEFWSRELNGVRPAESIEAELLAAVWLNELAVLSRKDSRKPIDRAALLKGINHKRIHPGFIFVENSGMIPPALTKHADGRQTLDLRPYIVLPSDPAMWTEQIVASVCDALRELKPEHFDPLIAPVLVGLYTTKASLDEFCERTGYPRPRFWFANKQSRKWTSRKERDVERWLRGLPERKTQPKSAYFTDARKRFPDLPLKAFNRCWKHVAPKEWKRSGPI